MKELQLKDLMILEKRFSIIHSKSYSKQLLLFFALYSTMLLIFLATFQFGIVFIIPIFYHVEMVDFEILEQFGLYYEFGFRFQDKALEQEFWEFKSLYHNRRL